MGRAPLVVVAIVAALLVFPAFAFGWAEGDITWEGDWADCPSCHSDDFPFETRSGPHQGFSATSSKCMICHKVHDAPAEGVRLLRRATVRDNCMVCHDGTGGWGVYGAIAARGMEVGGGHRIDTTNVIPGGDSATGGDRVQEFGGVDDSLSCNDCHNPHGANVVEPFSGERIRFHASDLNWLPEWSSSKLLRTQPTGGDRTVDVYGSDWCIACHQGRHSGGDTVNHPVDSLDTHAEPFHYDNVAILTSETSLETTYGSLGLIGTLPSMTWHNRGYVMPYPRTPEQAGHAPICQQCHEDSRLIGELGDVAPARVYRYGDGRTDGDAGTDNPLFQNFPHETQNRRMLVRGADGLCMNCHPWATLP